MTPQTRAATLALGLVALTACDEAAPAPEQQRFVAVEAKPAPAATQWCDKTFPAQPGTKFELPPVVADRQAEPAPLRAGRWTWVNVWATWCGPCKEEMPMLARWDEALDAGTPGLDVYFLSVDEDADLLGRFWQSHGDLATHPTARITELGAMEPWMARYGLPPSTAIPIHALVDPQGDVRCIRTGSVKEDDLKTVKTILAGG